MRTLAITLLIARMLTSTPPWLFLFKRDRKPDKRREEALDEIFAALRVVFETSATLKDEWMSQWERRDQAELPPKYRPDKYLYPNAVDAAYDTKFARGLLYQNRWRSRIDPLFESYDPNVWTRVRATIERSSQSLLAVQEHHRDALRADEASWIDRAVEGIDRARYSLRQAERQETPTHELIAESTFQTLYSALQLSEALLDGLRREAEDQ